jgi:ATP-dependent Lon protease
MEQNNVVATNQRGKTSFLTRSNPKTEHITNNLSGKNINISDQDYESDNSELDGSYNSDLEQSYNSDLEKSYNSNDQNIFISDLDNSEKESNHSRAESEPSTKDKKSFLFDSTVNNQNNLSEQIMHLVTEINWKYNLKETDINKYQVLYNKICSDISHVPKILDVLKLSMPYADKCELFEKIILLNNMTPMTVDFYDLKKYLNKIILEFKTFSISNSEYEKYKILENSLITIEAYKPIEYQILDLDISDYNKSFIYKRYKLLKETDPTNLQYHNKLKKWIEWVIIIPTQIKPMLISLDDSSRDKNKYLWDVKNSLDREIYGLEEVKEKILFMLNNKITNKDSKGLNFALSGPPGVAKTSIINVLSRSIDLPFFQINAAGMKDSSFLLGHNFTYEGSTPGAIMQALTTMKYKNGIIYFDEFDKISDTDQGVEISRTLLHITDFSQNNKFHDRYISEQIDIDLSNIWFIYSMNDKNLIDPTLRDRISIIEIEGYDKSEKKKIAKQFLIPTALNNINLEKSMITIDDSALDHLIDIAEESSTRGTSSKSGVRQLKHLIDEILMKINFLRTVTEDDVDHNNHKFNLSFIIKNFKLPLVITKQIIIDLNIKKNKKNDTFYSMYV